MKHEKFYGSEEPLSDNLDNVSTLTNQSITERHRDYFSPGVVKTPGNIVNNDVLIAMPNSFIVTVNNTNNTRVDVGWGLAYTDLGKRVIIFEDTAYDENPSFEGSINKKDDEGNDIPQSTGNIGVKLLPSITQQYIWIDYLETVDVTEYFPDPDTGKRVYTKFLDGYQILVTSTVTPPTQESLFLAKIITDNLGVISNINIDNRRISYTESNNITVHIPNVDVNGIPLPAESTQTYLPDTDVTVEDHVKGMGTGVLTKNNVHAVGINDIAGLAETLASNEPQNIIYQKETSTNGIVEGNIGLAAQINRDPLGVIIRPLFSAQVLYIAGVRFDAQTPVTPVDAQLIHPYGNWFVDFTALPSPVIGTYGIFLSKDITSDTLRLKAEAILLPFSSPLYVQVATVYFDPNDPHIPQLYIYTDLAAYTADDSSINTVDTRIYGTISTKDIQDATVTDVKIVSVGPTKIIPQGTGSTLDSDKLDGMHAANTSGSIPINNGILNVNLNAQYVSGEDIDSISRKPIRFAMLSKIIKFPGL